MSLYPSRGLELHGLEIKVSRNDWLRELKDPSKAEEIARHCDRWWLVVGDAAIVQPGELPPTWGLLVPRGKALVVKTEAPPLTDGPGPLTRPFLAAILRNLAEGQADAVPRSSIEAEVRKARAEGIETGQERERSAFEELRARIARFEEASGIEIDRWSAGRVGEAVKFLLNSDVEQRRRQLESLRDQARRIADDIERRLTETDGERDG